MTDMIDVKLTEAEAMTALEAIAMQRISRRCECDDDVGFSCRRCRRLESLGIDREGYEREVAYRYGKLMLRHRSKPFWIAEPIPHSMKMNGLFPDWPSGRESSVPYESIQMKRVSVPYRSQLIERQIPVERFVEYEEKDLDWLIPLGMAPERPLPDLSEMFKKIQREILNPSRSVGGSGILRSKFWIPGQE